MAVFLSDSVGAIAYFQIVIIFNCRKYVYTDSRVNQPVGKSITESFTLPKQTNFRHFQAIASIWHALFCKIPPKEVAFLIYCLEAFC